MCLSPLITSVALNISLFFCTGEAKKGHNTPDAVPEVLKNHLPQHPSHILTNTAKNAVGPVHLKGMLLIQGSTCCPADRWGCFVPDEGLAFAFIKPHEVPGSPLLLTSINGNPALHHTIGLTFPQVWYHLGTCWGCMTFLQSRLLIKTYNSVSPNINPWEPLLAVSCHWNFVLLITTLWSWWSR